MSKTLLDIPDFPKDLLKKKTLNLYKAYLVKDPDERLTVNRNIDLLAITPEDAVPNLLDNIPLEGLEEMQQSSEPVILSFVHISLKMADMKKDDLVDEGEPYFENGLLAITLNDKEFDVKVLDKRLEDLQYTADLSTEKRDYQFRLV